MMKEWVGVGVGVGVRAVLRGWPLEEPPTHSWERARSNRGRDASSRENTISAPEALAASHANFNRHSSRNVLCASDWDLDSLAQSLGFVWALSVVCRRVNGWSTAS